MVRWSEKPSSTASPSLSMLPIPYPSYVDLPYPSFTQAQTVQASALASSIGRQCLCWGYRRALRIKERTQPNPIAAYALGEGTKLDPIVALVFGIDEGTKPEYIAISTRRTGRRPSCRSHRCAPKIDERTNPDPVAAHKISHCLGGFFASHFLGCFYSSHCFGCL